MNVKQRIETLNRIEAALIEAARHSAISTNVVYAGKGWDTIAISAVNTNNLETIPSTVEGHYQ